MDETAAAKPASGTIRAYEPPAGAGVRVDGFAYAGFKTSTGFDSLLAKVIVHGADWSNALARAERAAAESK